MSTYFFQVFRIAGACPKGTKEPAEAGLTMTFLTPPKAPNPIPGILRVCTVILLIYNELQGLPGKYGFIFIEDFSLRLPFLSVASGSVRNDTLRNDMLR